MENTSIELSSKPSMIGGMLRCLKCVVAARELHWTLDVTYREDHLRTRDRQLAENLAWLRRFTLSLLTQYPAKKSVAMKRRLCGWNDNFLMQVLATHVT